MNSFETKKAARQRLQACIPIHSLTPEQARVEVAKDVLAAITLNKLEAGTGGDYVRMLLRRAKLNTDLRSQLPEMHGSATVCGIGALMLAHVARFDKFTIDRYLKVADDVHEVTLCRNEIVDHLKDLFSDRALNDIESVYEGYATVFGALGTVTFDLITEILKRYPGRRREEKTARLKAIMQNIIENNGTFVPEQLT